MFGNVLGFLIVGISSEIARGITAGLFFCRKHTQICVLPNPSRARVMRYMYVQAHGDNFHPSPLWLKGRSRCPLNGAGLWLKPLALVPRRCDVVNNLTVVNRKTPRSFQRALQPISLRGIGRQDPIRQRPPGRHHKHQQFASKLTRYDIYIYIISIHI